MPVAEKLFFHPILSLLLDLAEQGFRDRFSENEDQVAVNTDYCGAEQYGYPGNGLRFCPQPIYEPGNEHAGEEYGKRNKYCPMKGFDQGFSYGEEAYFPCLRGENNGADDVAQLNDYHYAKNCLATGRPVPVCYASARPRIMPAVGCQVG